MAERLLLDTCVIIWASQDEPLGDQAVAAIDAAWEAGAPLSVSPISAWEIGLLMSRGRIRSSREPLKWFEEFITTSAAEVVPLTVSILIASSYLPGEIHGDPADRILVATAREHGLAIVTRDKAILDYGRHGNVAVIEC